MIEIDGKIISFEIFTRKYICDLSKCKGICCVEGDSGAPLEPGEPEILERIYPKIKDRLTHKSQNEVERQGKWVIDQDGDKVTPIINGDECVYAVRKPDGLWSCAIEEAYNAGEIDWKKPISCHLYPIRVQHYKNYDALNFHDWHVCNAALALGQKEGVPVYKFLKEPIIRAWGEDFYNQMEIAAPEVQKYDEERNKR